MSKLTFEYATPAAMFEAKDEAYVASDLAIKYDGKVVGTAKVYIGIKGDTDLNKEVNAKDVAVVLVYSAKIGAGLDGKLLNTKEAAADPNLETLSYFLSDINTEGKIGADSADGSISLDAKDGAFTLVYSAKDGAGMDPKWPEVCPALKTLEGSCWAE